MPVVQKCSEIERLELKQPVKAMSGWKMPLQKAVDIQTPRLRVISVKNGTLMVIEEMEGMVWSQFCERTLAQVREAGIAHFGEEAVGPCRDNDCSRFVWLNPRANLFESDGTK